MTFAQIAAYERATEVTAADMLANGWLAHEVVAYLVERVRIAFEARAALVVTS